MDVQRENSPVEPAYPDAKEFLKNRAAFSAAILGAGVALGGCNPAPRMGGSMPVPPGGAKESLMDGAEAACPGGGERKEPSPRPAGDIPVMPEVDPPRLPGKARVEPPRVPGTPPAQPRSPEY